MPGYKLRRCTICKSFNAAFIDVNSTTGEKSYYCYNCWKVQIKPSIESASKPSEGMPTSEPNGEEKINPY
jgi:hypothetical protein